MSTSATTTFDDVLQEFYDAGFNYILDDSQTARAERWVNQSYQELCGLENWPFLRTSTTSANPVTISDLGRVLSVIDQTTKYKLVETDEDTLTDINTDLTITGTAGYYYVSYGASGPIVNAYPVTANQLKIVYFKNPVPLTSPGDILVVPDQWIDIVVLGAARRGYIDGVDQQPKYYAATQQEWQQRVDIMRNQLLPRYTYQATEVAPFSSLDW